MTDTLLAEYITRLIDALSQTTEMSHIVCGIFAFISDIRNILRNLGKLGSLGKVGGCLLTGYRDNTPLGLMEVCMSQIPRGYIVEELCRQYCRAGIGLESCGYPDRGNISVTTGKRSR